MAYPVSGADFRAMRRRLAFLFGHDPVSLDEPFLLEDLRNSLKDVRRGDLHLFKACLLGIPQPRQQIRHVIVVRHCHCHPFPLPTRLGHAGKAPAKGERPQADPAQPELPVESARPAAARTPVVFPDGEFRRPFRLGDDRFLGQRLVSSLPYARKGIPMSRRSSRPSSSVRAVVTMVMFMPRILSILS